jgi:hypothetical protein
MDTGYRDGLQAGYNDLRKHKDFHPEKHDAHEDGNHGYERTAATRISTKNNIVKPLSAVTRMPSTGTDCELDADATLP